MATDGMDPIGIEQVPKKSILERILYFSQIKKQPELLVSLLQNLENPILSVKKC